jgi:hypothetical protein
MRVSLACARVVVAIAIALMFASSSEAGRFARGRFACWSYWYVTPSQHVNAAPTAVASPQAGSPQATGPTIAAVSHEVVAPAPATATSATAVPTEAGGDMTVPYGQQFFQPSSQNSGGWSVLPRSGSDYGKFPPYR